jgi:hypothetical protein
MIIEIEYKKAYNLYRPGSSVLINMFKSRDDAVKFNHLLMLERIRVLKKIEVHNSKFKGTYALWTTK